MTRSPALMSSACATAQAVSISEIARRVRPIVFMLIASFTIDRAENGPAFFRDDLPRPSASAFGMPAYGGANIDPSAICTSPSIPHSSVHCPSRARLKQCRRRRRSIDDARAGYVGLVGEIAPLDVGRHRAAIVEAGFQSQQGVRLCLQRVHAVDEVGLRHPFDVGSKIDPGRVLVEKLCAQIVTWGSRQSIVSKSGIFVEAEVVEGISDI